MTQEKKAFSTGFIIASPGGSMACDWTTANHATSISASCELKAMMLLLLVILDGIPIYFPSMFTSSLFRTSLAILLRWRSYHKLLPALFTNTNRFADNISFSCPMTLSILSIAFGVFDAAAFRTILCVSCSKEFLITHRTNTSNGVLFLLATQLSTFRTEARGRSGKECLSTKFTGNPSFCSQRARLPFKKNGSITKLVGLNSFEE